MKRFLLGLVLLLPVSASARSHPKLKGLAHFGEHLLLGGGTEAGISLIAGRPRGWEAGLTAAAVVAAIKEGTDAYTGRDSRRMAAFHAATILAGAGVAAAIRH